MRVVNIEIIMLTHQQIYGVFHTMIQPFGQMIKPDAQRVAGACGRRNRFTG